MISKKNIINHLKRDKFELICWFISVKEYNITESYSGVLKSMKLDLVKSDIVEEKSTMSIYMVQRML
jgi:hypothetical protein